MTERNFLVIETMDVRSDLLETIFYGEMARAES
jgi:hypothetical protein